MGNLPAREADGGKITLAVGKITRVTDFTRVIYPRELHVTYTRRQVRILPRVKNDAPSKKGKISRG